MKYFIKKLFQTFVFLAVLIVLTALTSTLFIHIIFWFRPQVNILVYIGLTVSSALMMYAVFLKRWENKSLKVLYIEKETVEGYSFRKDYAATFISKENVVHTAAFLTVILINSIRIAITEQKPLAALLFQLVILTVVFTALNTLVWCCVHRRWLKSRHGIE